MRKFLSILCVLVVLFALCSCEPKSPERKEVATVEDNKEEKVVDFHGAPFEDFMYRWNSFANRKELVPCIDSEKNDRDSSYNFPMCGNAYIDYAVKDDTDSELLYTITSYDEKHFIFRSYREVPNEDITDEIELDPSGNGFFIEGDRFNGIRSYYNSNDPIEVYYVEFEKTGYAFSTEKKSNGKVKLGMVLEITGYWNIGPTRASKEYKKTDLNGPIFWSYEQGSGYYTVPRAFVYAPRIYDRYGDGDNYIDLETPLYLRNQIKENKDTFNAEKEGWKTSSLLGFRSTKPWDNKVNIEIEWPEGIVANLEEDMKYDSNGEMYINTPDSIVSGENTN